MVAEFQHTVYAHYAAHGRSFAWRLTDDPYHIVVSEIMLQQTQTQRVVAKYEQFIAQLPTFRALALAPERQVLSLWSGLGYNRRALALQAVARRVMDEWAGQLPRDPELLRTCKGIGPNTAGSITAFAFHMPVIFIETNIRAVFIHTFFKEQENIKDRELLPLVEKTLDRKDPRRWYYALMDYGVMIKKEFHNPSRKSASYARQSTFEGSERQIRGLIIKALTNYPALSHDELYACIPREPHRIAQNLEKLFREGLIKRQGDTYFI